MLLYRCNRQRGRGSQVLRKYSSSDGESLTIHRERGLFHGEWLMILHRWMNIYEELESRGLVADCTDKEALLKRLNSAPTVLYAGFDPTADSLHVGNLV